MTTIIEAASSFSPAQAAQLYRELGFSVLPCIGKRVYLRHWTEFQNHKPSFNQIAIWRQAGLFRNVALVLGPVSNNLTVIDLDGENAVNVFAERWPDLTDTFTVSSGGAKGKHLYFYATRPIFTATAMKLPNGGNIELRSKGRLITAPPSIHPHTNGRYKIDNPLPIKRVDLFPCREWILGLTPKTHLVLADDLKDYDSLTEQVIKPARKKSWGAGALRNECSEISRMPEKSGRNERLNRAAFKMGQLVADNVLTQEQVVSSLMAAAAACGLPAEEARHTIKSGLSAGMKNPRGIR